MQCLQVRIPNLLIILTTQILQKNYNKGKNLLLLKKHLINLILKMKDNKHKVN